MNDLLRTALNSKIQMALREAMSASDLKHPLLTGKLREIVLHNLIEPLLNQRYKTGTGKIVDYNGALSKEIDICVYSTLLHPPLFFSVKNNLGLFPIESVLSCIEVKSTLTKNNLEDAYKRFKHLEDSLIITSGQHDSNDSALPHIFIKNKYYFFSFKNGSKKYTPESVLELYSRMDPHWNSEPLIASICVAGQGWIVFTGKGWLHMPCDIKNHVHEEIIGFLSTLIQDLSKTEQSRGTPRIGYYLTDPGTTSRFHEGKFVHGLWTPNLWTFTNTVADS